MDDLKGVAGDGCGADVDAPACAVCKDEFEEAERIGTILWRQDLSQLIRHLFCFSLQFDYRVDIFIMNHVYCNG